MRQKPQNQKAKQSTQRRSSNQQEFERELKKWAQNDANRQEAAKRILRCKNENDSSLDLSGLGLTSLPKVIGDLTHLESLNLNKNQLTALPETFGNLTRLKRLNLGYNQLTSLPETFGNLTHLESLNLNKNQLTALPETFGNLVSLTHLYLNDNQLTSLSEKFGNLVSLTELHLSDNQLTSLPETFGNLVSLTNLLLSSNQLTSLPETFGNLVSLTNLFLSGNQLTSLPETLGNLTHLESLYLSSNQLTSLPETFGNLTHLESLYLGYNQLTSLPKTLGNLVSLTHLYLNDNQLTSIPETLGNLVSLIELRLGYNQLTALPEKFGNLVSLIELRLDGNQLTSIPETLGNLVSLTELQLDNNELTSLPETFGNLVNLKHLRLEDNQLTSLPETLGNLVYLTELFLRKNQLETIPDSLFNKRRYIDLEQNRVTQTEVGRLNQLARRSRVSLCVSVFEPQQATNFTSNQHPQQNQVINLILNNCQNTEEKAALQNFLNSPEIGGGNFNRFLSECPKKAGWKKDHGASMSKSLYELVNKMKEDEVLKNRCLTIADQTFEDLNCGDRIAISYVNMLLASRITQKQISEMSESEFFEYAKQGTVISLLGKEADDKITTFRQRGGALDEIEVRLAYLQAAPRLGVNLPNSEMLYRESSNVTNEELDGVVTEFNRCSLNRRIAEHIFKSEDLKKFGEIEKVIKEESGKEENDIDASKYRKDADYMAAIDQAQNRIIDAVEKLVDRYSGKEIDLGGVEIDLRSVELEEAKKSESDNPENTRQNLPTTAENSREIPSTRPEARSVEQSTRTESFISK